MDGINPTLGLVALLLGLSGHPRDAGQDMQHHAAMELPGQYDCVDFVGVAALAPEIPTSDSTATSEQGLGFDLGPLEPLPPLSADEVSSETNCETFVSQP